LFNRAREVVLRPQVSGGLLGAALIHVAIELTLVPVNLGVLGTLGYFTYRHWDSPNFTKKNISYATIGLITRFSGQGYVVEKYRQDHLGKCNDYARMKGGVEEGYGKVKGGTKALESEFEKALKTSLVHLVV